MEVLKLNNLKKLFSSFFHYKNENKSTLYTDGNLTKNEGYEITGENNQIIIVENEIERNLQPFEKIPGLNLIIRGDNNKVKLHFPFVARNLLIEIGNDNVNIEIEKNCSFFEGHIRCCYSEKQKIIIGENTTIYQAIIVLDESSSCVIGKNCLLASSINIFGADGHAIMDKNSKEFLNAPKHAVTIGDHCWIAYDVKIQKNAAIPNNTIVGAGSIVTKEFEEEYTIIGGNPAKILKRNVIWSGHSIYSLTKQNPSVYEEIKRTNYV